MEFVPRERGGGQSSSLPQSFLFFHAFMFQVDDWSIPAPTDDWSAPPKGELSISPQHKDDWCLSSPKEILNKDEWSLSSPKENLNKDEWCLSPPKEILNSPVDEWSLPPVVPKEIADKGDDEKVPLAISINKAE